MPVIIRKVWENFLNFVVPHGKSLNGQMKLVQNDVDESTIPKMVALHKYVNVRSHISDSSFDIERIKKDIETLFEVMMEVDSKHYNRIMQKIKNMKEEENTGKLRYSMY